MAPAVRRVLNQVFPDHWSFALGEIALYSFAVLVLTGTYLTFFFDPSSAHVTYHGRYVPLDGVDMSKAFASTLDISFDVRGGLLIRQVHHWAALLFVAVIFLHLMRVFLTGAYRKPRELNWVLGVGLVVISLLEGFTGYTLPDDVLSGASLHIADSIVMSIPVVGTWLAFLFGGGRYPGPLLLERLYVLHVLLLPGLLVALIAAHLALVVRQRHTHPRRRDARTDALTGVRTFPAYASRAGGLFLIVAGVLAGLGGLAQINPVWMYGPYQPGIVQSNSQPDWYMFWLEGGLRLFPPWEIRAFGHTVPAVFWPGVVLPTVFFGLTAGYPFLERRFTNDYGQHHVLQRPRDAPVRTACGALGMTFYAVLALTATDDMAAKQFHLDVDALVWAGRVLNWVLPVVAFAVTLHVCRARAAREHGEAAVDRRWPAERYVRRPDGDVTQVENAPGRPADAEDSEPVAHP